MAIVTFLSDYGTSDEFVGVCKGVMAGIAPQVNVIDITHEITPYDIQEGALVLAQSIGYFPVGVHLAVVDPGVGSSRRGLILGSGDGRFFVGPDNGLLVPAAEICGGVVWCRSIENHTAALPNASKTFHGRDVFAPVAAHLAAGADPAHFGPECAVESIVHTTKSPARTTGGLLMAKVQRIDRFGNLQLNAKLQDLELLGMGLGSRLRIEVIQAGLTEGERPRGQAPGTGGAGQGGRTKPGGGRATADDAFTTDSIEADGSGSVEAGFEMRQNRSFEGRTNFPETHHRSDPPGQTPPPPAGQTVQAALEQTFSSVPPGGLVVFEDSNRQVAIGVNGGNAAKTLGLRRGADVRIRRLPQ